MNLSEEKKIKHVGLTIAIGFFSSVLAFAIAFFFPPDFTTNPPTFPEGGMIAQEISLALFIFGCTVVGLKLAEEKKTLPAAGFTLMAIAQGLYFILFFLNIENPDPEEALKTYTEGYKTFCGMLYFLLPSMILIAFYSEYPRWVNILGVVACIPNIIVYGMFMSTKQYSPALDQIGFVSSILFNLTALVWGIYALRNMRRELNALKNKSEV